jgi:hypothetical protein
MARLPNSIGTAYRGNTLAHGPETTRKQFAPHKSALYRPGSSPPQRASIKKRSGGGMTNQACVIVWQPVGLLSLP